MLYDGFCLHIEQGIETDFMADNHDADNPFSLQWVERQFGETYSETIANLKQKLIN